MKDTSQRVHFSALLRHDDARLRRAAIKLTHVGEQTGPVQTIVIQACYFLPPLAAFQAFQGLGAAYVNDALPYILNFSVLPETMRTLLGAIADHLETAHEERERPALSVVAIVSAPEGTEGSEAVLSRTQGVRLHQLLKETIAPSHPVGAAVLRLQRETAYRDLDTK